MSNQVCKICGTPLTIHEDKICDCCFERMSEEKEDREISKTEKIFGGEEAYYQYRVGSEK